MSRDWPDEIELEDDGPDRVRYRLPVRHLGPARRLAWGVVVVGLVLAYWMLELPLVRFVANRGQWGDLASALFWIVVTFALVSYPLRYALLLLFGHCEITLADGWLTAGERAGAMWRTRQWPLGELKRLQVVGLGAAKPATSLPAAVGSSLSDEQAERLRELQRAQQSDDRSDTRQQNPFGGPTHPFNALTGMLYDGKRLIVVTGYPRDWLQHLADDISARTVLPRNAGNRPQVEAAAPIVGIQAIVAEATAEVKRGREPEVFDQPPESNVELESFPDGITLRVPPRGVWKGSAGLFQFGIVWCVFIGGFTVLFAVVGGIQGGGGGGWGGVGGVLVAFAMMGLFWLVGAGMLAWGWRMGKQESVAAIVGEKMMVMQTGLWRSTRREWQRSDVRTVAVGPSGMEVNDVPVMELQIHGPDKKLFGMLAGRDRRELTWMATVLRRALRNEGLQGPPTSGTADSTEMESR